MPKKKVLSYEDKKFDQGNSLVDSLQQAFVDFKQDKEKIKSWNMPVADLQGVTMKIYNDSEMCLTFHRVEVCSAEQLNSVEVNAKKMLKEVEKELKARFKKLTGKPLELKKKKEDRTFEKYQTLYADTSWVLGYGRTPVAKFFVRDTIVYDYSSDVAL